ncbi:hypothetical protein, conserved [Leishmania tarentolae]|uniref:Uncharacterized protein n=1 Tax=Leishmania tarentolae TaxID=5689 RepID=A0A640KAR2_LEITA|nr:hypothetical protein, conserved [Leishmania tarentolae]
MNSREASKTATDPPQQRPTDAVTVPASLQRFYIHFMVFLTQRKHPDPATRAAAVSTPLTSSHRRSASTSDGQDDTLRRLTCAQEEALGPRLWQWLALFSLAVQPAGEAPKERDLAASAVCSATPSRTLGPHDVERLFRSGFSSLLPLCGSSGGASELGGSRLPIADPPAPWHCVLLADHTSPERALVAALSALSCNGPLFSAWCALCYTCVGASLLANSSHSGEEEGHAVADRSEKRVSVEVEAIRSALQRLCHAWNSAVELADAATGGCSSRPDTVAARRNVDACATLQLWATVYATCTTPGWVVEAAPIAHGKGDRTPGLQAPPLPFSIWAVQWYHECTRIAAHGADEGFHSDEAGVSVELVTRIMHYMCHRLEVEVVRRSRRHERTASAASRTATVELHKMHAETTGPLSPTPPLESNVPSPLLPMLRVGTLTALALQSAMNLVGDAADRRGGAVKRSGGRKGGAPPRRRRRAWRMSDDDDDDDSDDGSSLDDLDYGSGEEGSGRWRADAQSGPSRFISSQQEQFEVAIASGVLTTYSVCSADDNVAQPASRHYMHRLTGEQYLRKGTVYWWTLRDSQQHRQLTAETRSTSS